MTRTTSELPAGAKCTRCRARATIRLPHHHAIFCVDCFHFYFKNAFKRAMKHFRLPVDTPDPWSPSPAAKIRWPCGMSPSPRLATHGLHLDLGIEDFSEVCWRLVEAFRRAT